MLQEAIERLTDGRDLEREEARQLSLAVLGGGLPDAAIAGLLVALKAKGETSAEIAGFVEGMREVATMITPEVRTLVDTCGTGGDRKGTFNISTTAGIIAAGAGVGVAKHGNRGISSACGSADVLEELGVDIAMEPEKVRECIERVGIGFMFAPGFHPAMKRVMEARKALGVPTIFNILGPLANPAGARAQVLGVNREELAPIMGAALIELGTERAFVLYGRDGMDEFTLAAETLVCQVERGSMKEYEVSPEDLGIERCDPGELTGGDAGVNAGIVAGVLAGREGPCLEISVANAAFAVVAGGDAGSLDEGVELARESVESGKAAHVLERLVAFSADGGVSDVSA